MHAFGVRSSSSQHFTSANPGFLFMPPSFREGVMGQAEPAPLLQPLCGCWCALNQLSYKCQPSPYSRTRPPTRGSWGSAGQCPVPLCARLRRTCRPLVLRARGSLPLPLTSQSQEPSPPFFRHWRHSASVPTLQKKEDGSSPSSFKKQNSNPSVLALPQPFFQSLLFHGIQSKFTTLQHQ